jgi:ABC-type Na+ transport system ATPase subunit NatA
MSDALLTLEHIETFYGPVQVHFDVNFQVRRGQIVSLLGGNASGKSTTMKLILGLHKPRAGSITFEGEAITGLSTPQIVRRGVGHDSILTRSTRFIECSGRFVRLPIRSPVHRAAKQHALATRGAVAPGEPIVNHVAYRESGFKGRTGRIRFAVRGYVQRVRRCLAQAVRQSPRSAD